MSRRFGHYSNDYIIIIIIMSCCQRRSPWPSLITRLYRSSLPIGLQGYILYQSALLYIGSTWMSCLCSSMWKESTGVCRLGLRSYFQQCIACLIRLTWIVFVMGDKWPYSCSFVGCCLEDLFNIARTILERFLKNDYKDHAN